MAREVADGGTATGGPACQSAVNRIYLDYLVITPTLNYDRRGSVVGVKRLSAVIMCHHEPLIHTSVRSSERSKHLNTLPRFTVCRMVLVLEWIAL